jgi:hypothetical protein
MCLISDVGILKFLKKICCSFESNKTQKINLYNCVHIIYNLQQKIIFWGWGKILFFYSDTLSLQSDSYNLRQMLTSVLIISWYSLRF